MMADLALFYALQGVVDIIVQPLLGRSVGLSRSRSRLVYNPPRDPMSLLDARDLAKSYGAHDIFQDVSISVAHQARIGLVGPNGVGKTTLLRLLAGIEQPDQGSLHRARGLDIGYLPQESTTSARLERDMDTPLWESTLAAFSGLLEMEARLAQLETAMADPHEAESAMARYGPLQETFERDGGYTFRSEAKRVLSGLGFTREEFQRPLRDLSGGERTRALLARLMLQDPDLLLLDEPTNHLDLEAVAWLESWIGDWPGAVLVVSHDRYFLDQVVDHVIDLSATRTDVYRGNYSAYVAQREERRAFNTAQYESQQEFVAREQAYIRKNIAGQNTRQAQGRRKRLERFLRDDAVGRPQSERTMHMGFEGVDRSGDLVLRTHDLVIRHLDGDRPLFEVPDLILHRGECAALIGPNGAGKTTFLKTLLGNLDPWQGEAKLGESVDVAYFAQAHEGLNLDRTVLRSFMDAAPELSTAEARDRLARFLFTGDMVDAPIRSLSGGERGRLVLARLAQQEANLLLLDEPTNHLDLPSQEVLQAALDTFPGTVLLVSHDRYLIDALATQVWAVSPRENRLSVHRGDYHSYLESQRAAQLGADQAAGRPPTRSKKPAANHKPLTGDRRLEEVEALVDGLEAELSQLVRKIEAAGTDRDEVSRLSEAYAELKVRLDAELAVWERLVRSDRGA
jgi:ATP-binding cassette subfamily F protein 3